MLPRNLAMQTKAAFAACVRDAKCRKYVLQGAYFRLHDLLTMTKHLL
jgi:hypothetical protein